MSLCQIRSETGEWEWEEKIRLNKYSMEEMIYVGNLKKERKLTKIDDMT